MLGIFHISRLGYKLIDNITITRRAAQDNSHLYIHLLYIRIEVWCIRSSCCCCWWWWWWWWWWIKFLKLVRFILYSFNLYYLKNIKPKKQCIVHTMFRIENHGITLHFIWTNLPYKKKIIMTIIVWTATKKLSTQSDVCSLYKYYIPYSLNFFVLFKKWNVSRHSYSE